MIKCLIQLEEWTLRLIFSYGWLQDKTGKNMQDATEKKTIRTIFALICENSSDILQVHGEP